VAERRAAPLSDPTGSSRLADTAPSPDLGDGCWLPHSVPSPRPSHDVDAALLAAVWRGPEPKEAERLAFVLAAVGIPALIARADADWLLLVPADRAASARAQLDAYAAENTDAATTEARPAQPAFADPTVGLLAAAAILVFLDASAGRALFGLDWWRAGTAVAALIQGGELWRAVTALGLHSGFDHLGGNLLFGALFFGLLAGEIGTGLACLAGLVGGAAGNLANAWWQGPDHAAVGASTAVFAALGILAVRAWRQRSPMRGLRRLAPLAGGVLLLVWLGMSGERTDIAAHVLGFAAGALLALPLSWLPLPLLQSRRLQQACGAAALALFTTCWVIALLHSG
jgi:membrane associated rhomboid family serine protease